MSKGNGTSTTGMAQSIAQTVMADRANAAEPAPAAPPAARAKGTQNIPPGFADTVKEIKYEPREQDAFGAVAVGDEIVSGGPVEAGFMPGPAVVEDEKPAKAKAASAEEGAEGEEMESEGAPAAAETEEGAEKPAGEPATEPEKVVEPPPTKAAQRRAGLDALRLAAENRKLIDTLQVERRTRAAAESSWKAERDAQVAQAEKLRGAPLAERLKELGVETKEELLEMAITGKLNLPAERAAPKVEPKVDVVPEKLAAIEAELQQYRGQKLIGDHIAAAGLSHATDKIQQRATEKWQAGGSRAGTEMDYLKQAIAIEPYAAAFSKELAESADLDIPLSRTDPRRLEAIREAALGMWEASGFKPGAHAGYLKQAADTSEEMAREEMAPRLKALGVDLPARGAKVVPKPGLAVPPPVGAPKAKAPSPPVGKRLAARPAPNVDDDGLPMDAAQRDAVIKREMAKAGHKGWGSSV